MLKFCGNVEFVYFVGWEQERPITSQNPRTERPR